MTLTELWNTDPEPPTEPAQQTEEELRKMIVETAEPRGFYQTTVGKTLPGLVARGITRIAYGPGTEAPAGEFGYVGNLMSDVGGYALDPTTYLGGAVGRVGAEKLAAGIIERGAAATAERLVVRGIPSAVALGAITATRDPIEQYIETGEVKYLDTARRTAQATFTGELLGAAGTVGKYARLPTEAATLAIATPAIEGRPMTLKDATDSAAIVTGFWLASAIPATGAKLLLKDYRERVASGQEDPVPNKSVRDEADLPDVTRKEAASVIRERLRMEATIIIPTLPFDRGVKLAQVAGNVAEGILGRAENGKAPQHVWLAGESPEALTNDVLALIPQTQHVPAVAERFLAGIRDGLERIKRGELQELTAMERLAEDIKEIKRNAGAIRSDQGVVPEEGIQPEGGEAARRADLQRQAEEGPEAGGAALPRVEAQAPGEAATEKVGYSLEDLGRELGMDPTNWRPEPGAEPRSPIKAPEQMIEPEGGPKFVAIDALEKSLRSGLRTIVSLLKQFRSRGELPKELFELKLASESEYRTLVREAKFAQDDLQKAIKKEFGSKKLSVKGEQTIDAALRGDPEAIAGLPERTRNSLAVIRSVVDSLSRRIRETVPMSERMEAAFTANEGVYLRRTYSAHYDPKWSEKVPQWVRDQFKQTLIDAYPELADNQIEQMMNALLYDAAQAANPIAFWAKAKLGSKDLTGLMRRKDLSEAFRMFLGEEQDPFVNFTRTVMYQARLIANQKFLSEAREAGLGRWFWEKGDPNIPPEAKAEIASPGSEVMNPLNGLYTYPEIAAEFARVFDPVKSRNAVARIYYAALIAAKAAKTVESHVGIIRNLMSNPMIMVRNGAFKFWNVKRPFQAMAADLGWTKEGPSREYLLEAQRYGVLDQSTSVQEMNLLFKGAAGRSIDDILVGKDYQIAKRAKDIGVKAWQWGDNFYKLYQWEIEQRRYQQAYPEQSPEQVKAKAAEIVRTTQPTAAMIPRGVRFFQRLPLTETFIGWPAEILRTSFNTLKLASKEIADPRTRGIGMSRLLGSALVATGAYALKHGIYSLFGVNEQNDKDAVRFLYDYQENAPFVMLSNPHEGKINYIDLSFSDPHSVITRPIIGILRGEDWEDSFWRASRELFGTFAGENIIAEMVMDLARNRDKDGYAVWNVQSPITEKLKKIGTRLAEPFIPASAQSLNRLRKAFKDVVDPSGRSYDPTVETIAQFGLRAQEMDIRQRLSRKARNFMEATNAATSLYRSKLTQRGSVTDDELLKAREDSEAARKDLFMRLSGDAQAAIRLGVSPTEVRAALQAGGIGKRDAADILSGKYEPYQPSKQLERNFKRKAEATPVEGAAGVDEYRRRRALTTVR